MTAPNVSETALREHLAAWLGGSRRRTRTILVHAQPTWSGAPVLEFGDAKVRVVEGVSGLAALDAMRSADEDEFTAVLTALTESELGTAVVLDAEKQKVTDLDEWNIVPALFGARDAVARPVRDLGPWVPRLLSALAHDRGFTPAPGGVLSADHVVRSMLAALLGLDRIDALESSTALARLDDLGVRAGLSDLDPDVRTGLIRAVATHVDAYLAMALRAAGASGHVSAIAVGLVVGELWAAGAIAPDATIAAARVRAEQYIGTAPSNVAAQRYGVSAKLITQRWLADGDQHAREVLEQAEALCDDLGWTQGAAASDLLPAGLRARVGSFAAAIESAVAAPSAHASLTVDSALEAIEAHGARATFVRSLDTARMAARLVRWLSAVTEPVEAGLGAALLAYMSDGSWAERALGDIWSGDTDRSLAQAYRSLAHAVQRVRRGQDAAAAGALTGALMADTNVLPVESLLSEVVVPLAAHDRVLLVVLDGMSAPTAVELAAELPARGWIELVQEPTLRRAVALAALPTITEYSRTSLFAGELLAGNQLTEKSRFAAAVNGVVFHKDDLRSEAGHALPPIVTDAIADSDRKIVGVVINTIDDALAGADVDSLRWTVHSIAHLDAVLGAAQEAGRTVILTSDHGHIVERGGELRYVAQASARWRDASTAPAASDEVSISGPRVLAPGGSAVLAVSDGIRYAQKKPGYHGGASLAELTIPIIVIRSRGSAHPRGWIEAPPQEPKWWNEPTRLEVEPSASPARLRKQKPSKVSADAALFELEPQAASGSSTQGPDIARMLVTSATYNARRAIAGRHPVDDARAMAIVRTLVGGGGRAHRDTLASQSGVPTSTMSGLLAALRRVLNVDGYPVIEIDADGITVILDIPLLREQFALGS